jgi:hypothetical protein
MSASLVLASLVLLLWLGWKGEGRKAAAFAGAGFVSAVLLLAPYGFALLHYHGSGPVPGYHHWGDWRNLWWILVKTPVYLSVWQMKYFLFPQAGVFFAGVGKALSALYYADPFGWLAKVAVWAAAALVLFRWARGRERSPLLVFAALGLVVHGILLQYQNLATYPHYFLPFWWAHVPAAKFSAGKYRHPGRLLRLPFPGAAKTFLLPLRRLSRRGRSFGPLRCEAPDLYGGIFFPPPAGMRR